MKDTLLVFIRNPQLGKVKTRLARTLGDAEALRVYHILLAKTRVAALGLHARRLLFYSDFIEESDIWNPHYFYKKTQEGADLGARMQHAFETAFAEGAKKAIIIGSDCPELSGPAIRKAFSRLDKADVVLGPVPDGGYYLLGMKQLEPTLFKDIAWSTETVLAHTIEKIEAAGKSYALLPELSDVDTEADWKAYLKRRSLR